MGVLDGWDRRNQRAVEEQNQVEETVAPGVVAAASVPAVAKIAVLTVVVAVAGVSSGRAWGFAVAAVAPLIGGGLCASLVRDTREDVDAWRRRRRERA